LITINASDLLIAVIRLDCAFYCIDLLRLKPEIYAEKAHCSSFAVSAVLYFHIHIRSSYSHSLLLLLLLLSSVSMPAGVCACIVFIVLVPVCVCVSVLLSEIMYSAIAMYLCLSIVPKYR